MDFELICSGFLIVARETALLTLQVLPYLVVGAAAGAGLQALLSQRWSEWLFGGRGARPLLTAISAAALLPGCSCATMPMAAGLKGSVALRLGTLAAFIFMSPLLSPITVELTWALLGWQMTVARVVFSVIGSFALGLLVNAGEPWLSPGNLSSPAPTDACGLGGCAPAASACAPTPQPRFWPSFRSILRSVTPYFLLGMVSAGTISALLPEDSIPRYLGGASGVTFLLGSVGTWRSPQPSWPEASSDGAQRRSIPHSGWFSRPSRA